MTEEKRTLQWHPAFYAGIQIEFAEEAHKLIFENEHQLGTKPKEIDVLIIKKDSKERIEKNIGQIFRIHNIVEYKSPEDYLSIDDFYKVYGYACFYKSDVKQLDMIKAEEITISFVCKRYPYKLIKHLQEARYLSIEEQEKGIYYILGDIFPMQLLVTPELSEETNFWLKNLTNDLEESKVAEKLLREYAKHKKSNLYKAVMNIIVRANQKLFRRKKDMCEALMELMQEELEESRKQGMKEGLLELVRKKISKGKSIEQIADELEEDRSMIEELIKSL